MRGGAVPPAVLLAALGLALAFAPRSAWVRSLFALLGGAGLVAFLPIPRNWLEAVYLAHWASVIATAASVHFVRRLGHPSIAIALSLNAGVWASAVVRLSGSPFDLFIALPWVLILFPASWVVNQHNAIPVKVVASWIIAVAGLAATLQFLSVTPGYLPDHLE
jgi:hypothetical protein